MGNARRYSKPLSAVANACTIRAVQQHMAACHTAYKAMLAVYVPGIQARPGIKAHYFIRIGVCIIHYSMLHARIMAQAADTASRLLQQPLKRKALDAVTSCKRSFARINSFAPRCAMSVNGIQNSLSGLFDGLNLKDLFKDKQLKDLQPEDLLAAMNPEQLQQLSADERAALLQDSGTVLRDLAIRSLQPDIPSEDFAALGSNNLLARNFVGGSEMDNKYIQATIDSFKTKRDMQNSLNQQGMTLLDAMGGIGGYSHGGSENEYVNAIFAALDAERKSKQMISRETVENAEENLEDTREAIEAKAEEALAPKDADGKPVVAPEDTAAQTTPSAIAPNENASPAQSLTQQTQPTDLKELAEQRANEIVNKAADVNKLSPEALAEKALNGESGLTAASALAPAAAGVDIRV